MNAFRHQVQWVTAAPLWPAAQHDRAVMQRPVILRFTSDQFMEELIAELAARPQDLGARSVTGTRPSYREPAPGDDSPTTEHLKLYQPAHGHFYLVASSLVCRLPGLPDHVVDRAHDENAGFVIRRLDPQNHELALIGAGAARSWQPVTRADALAAGEDLLPMFPLATGEPGHRRRLHAGVVPVARQDELQGAPIAAATAASAAPSSDERLESVKARVSHAIELLKAADPPAEAIEIETSRFILLDLADFLQRELTAVWNTVFHGASAPARKQGALVTLLGQQRVEAGTGPTLADAVSTAWREAATIVAGGGGSLHGNLRRSAADLPGKLQTALADALHEVIGAEPAPPAPAPVATTFYVLRCVYRRTHCGPLKPDVLSTASEPFTLAPFFDPDAPARPIRISLPIDPSIAGLRKFRKNVTVALSAAMRQKLAQTGGLKDDKVEASPEFDCPNLSFSIPTITICAMVLLFIMLSLLNLVFWWLPFVKICQPTIKLE